MAIPFSLAASVLLLILSLLLSSSSPMPSSSPMLGQSTRSGRQLRTFKELRGNTTFECSPSGPCVACHYSEKSDEKYHCSETGYRIPFKCAEVEHFIEENGQKYQKGRLALQGTSELFSSNHWNAYSAFQQRKDFASPKRLLGRRLLKGSSSKEEKKKQHYMIFKSCTPTVDGEKLTILGFEGIILCLFLVSYPIIYIRKKRTSLASGLGMLRIPTNSRY